jgi:hypothetical protein
MMCTIVQYIQFVVLIYCLVLSMGMAIMVMLYIESQWYTSWVKCALCSYNNKVLFPPIHLSISPLSLPRSTSYVS